jgi:hypothetical protein
MVPVLKLQMEAKRTSFAIIKYARTLRGTLRKVKSNEVDGILLMRCGNVLIIPFRAVHW